MLTLVMEGKLMAGTGQGMGSRESREEGLDGVRDPGEVEGRKLVVGMIGMSSTTGDRVMRAVGWPFVYVPSLRMSARITSGTKEDLPIPMELVVESSYMSCSSLIII